MEAEKHSILTRKSHVIALITALSLLIAFAGYFYYRNEERTIRQEKESELKSIAELKIKQISDWYKDELNDAGVISRNPFLMEVVHKYLNSNSDKSHLVTYLNQIKAEHGYSDIILTAAEGKLLSSSDKALQHVEPAIAKAAKQAVRQKSAVSTDVYRGSVHNVTRIDFISPISDNNNSVVAALVFRMDPDDFLYPLLESWPTSSRTSETYIARKEEDSVIVLNKLRHLETPALSHRYSANDREAAIVRAAKGYKGFLDAIDYRGVKVVAYASPIPDTPWFMVAKVDRTELFEDLYFRVGIALVLAVCLILLVGVSLSYLYSRRSEKLLRKSETLFRNLFENHTAVKLILDPDTGAIIDANNAAANFYGWSREQLKQMKIQDINTLSAEEVQRDMKKAGTLEQTSFEFRHRKADGSIRNVEVFSSQIVANGKNLLHSIIHDITDRKQAEERLSQSEAEFRRLSQEFNGLLDAIPDILLLLDKNLKVLWANRAAAESIGEKPEALAGRFCHTLWYGRATPCEPCPVAESLLSGKRRNATVTRPDGRIWDVRTVPLTDEQGRITNVIEVERDITVHRQMEDQLRHSQKLEGVGQLAGGIAHDFNNVLTAVVGFAGLLQVKMDMSDPLRHYADEIMAAGQRGASLTHQILAFSRKQVLDMKPVNLNEIIRNLEKMLHRLLREDIRIELNLFSKDLPIFADASQIDQVMINLATNARDAMPDGGKLSIATEPFEMDREYSEMHGYGSPGKYALLTISDSGCGMDPETKSRIFEPFFTTKEVGKGTGLGLAVVHGIVKQHNGYINIYSEVRNGTIFKIYLPLTEYAAKETKEETEDQIRGGTETILIAEDDASLRTLSRTVLSHYGYKVLDAVDGDDAVIKFSRDKESIKLVILDGIMPNKNGREAFDEILKLCPDMKAIFMSGYAEDIFTHDGIPDTTAVFIQKPVTPDKLLRTVRAVLDGQ
ncbi:MAG: PAS domain S-box protein [Nitrospirae bacterium]|nr:PAS domain S-box protein [Nitrospirota bacterium]